MDLISYSLSAVIVTGSKVRSNEDRNRSLTVGQAEPRYNLATKVMSNGVEVIVAGDRSTRPGEPEYLRLLSSTVTRPITLAPHTLTNHMSMVLPTDHVNEAENQLASSLHPANAFVTRTYYTTYTYLTTVTANGKTDVSSKKTTISNVKTEEMPARTKYPGSHIRPTYTKQLTLSASPTLQTEVYHTTYTYINTLLDGDQPLVMTSRHTVTNTMVAANDHFEQLEPSETFPTTNTYLKTIEFTKTLTDGTDYQVVSTKDILTQVVVTEKPEKETSGKPLVTDVTKTYFVTYTYFSTYVEGGETKVKSDVSVSSDVTVEKFLMKPKKTESKNLEKNTRIESVSELSSKMPVNILATKTYLTTFTYFTTLLQGISGKGDTKVTSRTRVVQNVITESLSPQDLNSNYYNELKTSLDNQMNTPIVALGTLKNGDKIEITAFNGEISEENYEKTKIKPTKMQMTTELNTALNQIDNTYEDLELMKTSTKLNHVKQTPPLQKSKTTLTYKQKVKPLKTAANDITAEALISEEKPVAPTIVSNPIIDLTNHNMNNSESTPVSYSTMIMATSTVTSHGATLLPGEQVIVLKDDNGQVTLIPVSDPAKKKQQLKNPSNDIQVSDILSLGSLGINSMNVLGPVFNAMAELINNNLHTKNADAINKRNDTAPVKKTQPAVKKPTTTNSNPLMGFVSGLKAPTTVDPKTKSTTPRIPVYIPVGSFAGDSEFGESQDSPSVSQNSPDKWRDKWPDTQAKNFEKKRPHDNPLTILEGGIPISPGQIITTNSDVIIGRPGSSGPRPPNFALKNNAPLDMKPPPPPSLHSHHQERPEDPVGQHSTNQGVDPDLKKEEDDLDMMPPPPPPQIPSQLIHDSQIHKHVYPPLHQDHSYSHTSHQIPHFNKHKHEPHDSGAIDLNPPPVPPKIHPQLEIHRPITINHQPHEIIPYKPTHVEGIIPIPVHLGPHESVENYLNPADIRPDALGQQSVPLGNHIHHERGQNGYGNEATPHLHFINPNGVQVVPSIANEPVSLIVSQGPQMVERSTGQHLLVNIQPSQVANVVIPHGSSTALIISGQKQHSLKGEVIDDPSPHPEPETVGFVGAEPVLKLENSEVTPPLINEVIPVKGVGEVGRPEQIATDNRPHFFNHAQEGEVVHIRPKPNYNEIGMKPPQYPSQHVHPNHYRHTPPFSHQSPPINQYQPPVQHQVQSSHNEHKVSNGIYVDISPPGHLPPPELAYHQGNNVPVKQQINVNDNLSHHQSGLVHDVPLNAQVQLGSGQAQDHSVKEILVNVNVNPYENPQGSAGGIVQEATDSTSYHDEVNYIKRPGNDIPENMSPPPLPKPDNHRPHRPYAPPHQPNAGQRFPASHGNSYPPVPKPADFMVPPPQLGHRPSYKPHPDTHSRPIMIPVGAGAPQNYPLPRPEDILIIPQNVRPEPAYPGNDGSGYNKHKLSHDSSDLDLSGGDDPLQTEDGEEIQESNSRPLLPGQVPTELQKLNRTQPIMSDKTFESNKKAQKINTNKQSNVGLSQTLSFGPTNDKTDVIDHDYKEPETIVGSKIHSEFNGNNEAVVSVSVGSRPKYDFNNESVPSFTSKPNLNVRGDENDFNDDNADAEKIFGSKIKPSESSKKNEIPKDDNQGSTTAQSNVHPTAVEINEILTPPKVPDVKKKPEEVMGLSPPPLDRPRRPSRPSRPKPPYKFERPTTPKTTLQPIAMENDFPPVRSPDFNKKPLKPQDNFPPRLPENFIHHDHTPIRPQKPRPENKYPHKNQERPTVTSLPIDVPGSSTTEKTTEKNRPAEQSANDSRDSYYTNLSLAEINGHSKPVKANGEPNLSSMRPPPPTQSRPKPVNHHRSPPNHHQNSVKPIERPVQENNRPYGQVIREKIRPTPINDGVIKTNYRTKVSTSVTPTLGQQNKNWKEGNIIVGSETIFDPNRFNQVATPVIQSSNEKKNIATSLITTGSTTIFGDIYTVPLLLQPSKIITSKDGVKGSVGSDQNKNIFEGPSILVVATKPVFPTYTTTLTVTTTMTTVVHSVGHKPLTKTIVLTKTLISTIVDKVTETETLVKPTTSTVTQTHTIATTKTALVVPSMAYPSPTKYPTGATLKPEIFVADPHSKDIMTISVSSSMNKDKNKKVKDKLDVQEIGFDQSENESILVVMTDKTPKLNLSGIRGDHYDSHNGDSNDLEDSRVLLGGVLMPNHPKDYKDIIRKKECLPECKATRNELCQKLEGIMKCVCRPGFARMFPDRPCKPTYTYNMKLTLDKLGSEKIGYGKDLSKNNSPEFVKLAAATKEGLDRMIMQSDLRDVYHGVAVNGFQAKDKKAMVDFYVQLSENTDESRLMDVFKKTLRTSNFSLGGTELFAAREADNLDAQDFNECSSTRFHDCSEHARCFNLKGTYTCSCKEGFTDLSENNMFPGRMCSDMIGCEYCGYHGTCYTRGDDQMTCECFQWYSGDRCRINLKVLLIALVTIGAILLALLLVCIVLTCIKRRSRSTNTSRANGSSGYLRYRGPPCQSLDKRAMIADSSSESSVENLPYINPPPPPSGTLSAKRKPVLRQNAKGPAPRPTEQVPMEQRDRSVTVMIPRAKYRPVPPISPHLTMSTFSPDKHLHRTAAQISTEQKLISYLEGHAREASSSQQRHQKEQQKVYDYKAPNNNVNDPPRSLDYKKEPRVFEYEYKTSNMNITDGNSSGDRRSSKHGDSGGRFRRHSDSTNLNSDNANSRSLQHRKYSAGALVSAGFEVSATVGLRHEDLLEEEQSAILNSSTMKSSRSQFTTLNRTGDHKTMSEARSYDETTIHPPTRSLKTHYSGSSPSSRVNNDEGHTMVERDLGSTFLMPESHLFKQDRDRGSDISNFDSL